jgi:hypothetical protein
MFTPASWCGCRSLERPPQTPLATREVPEQNERMASDIDPKVDYAFKPALSTLIHITYPSARQQITLVFYIRGQG